MMYKLKKQALALVAFLCLFLAGCVVPQKILIHYNLREDLQGAVTVTYYEMRSDRESVADQQKEMREFYESDLNELKEREGFPTYGLKNKKYNILNKTDLSCDVKWTGEFDNFITSLSVLMDPEIDFEVKKSGSRITFTLLKNYKPDPQFNEIDFSVQYQGNILENNAHAYDEQSHLMKWHIPRISKSGIYFVLEIET